MRKIEVSNTTEDRLISIQKAGNFKSIDEVIAHILDTREQDIRIAEKRELNSQICPGCGRKLRQKPTSYEFSSANRSGIKVYQPKEETLTCTYCQEEYTLSQLRKYGAHQVI